METSHRSFLVPRPSSLSSTTASNYQQHSSQPTSTQPIEHQLQLPPCTQTSAQPFASLKMVAFKFAATLFLAISLAAAHPINNWSAVNCPAKS
ncbi:hypothetical protein PtB15_11B434 [Puccinia triticina]|nr:hypothetical protein PtB15_11B434 [Puccinia triticina]